LSTGEESEWALYVDCYDRRVRDATMEEGEWKWRPRYPLFADRIEKLLMGYAEQCHFKGSIVPNAAGDPDEYLNRHCRIKLRSGLFNFIEELSVPDAYSYAIFPKNDVVGILVETSAQLSARGTGVGFLDVGRQLNESTTASVLVGYGDGRGGGPSSGNGGNGRNQSIAFGWVISPRGDMQPTQKSQLALVSVPAWTRKMSLKARVGWLDRHGNPVWEEDAALEREIAVPPDFETFDSVFRRDAWVTREPRIQDEEMEKAIHARVGKATQILIPGTRLWRSASVTLGAQLADRIRVLPNMEGLIAEFAKVELPYAGAGDLLNNRNAGEACEPHAALKSRPVKLRVWTSEGVAKAAGPVCVYFDPAKAHAASAE
jgi:hypothetical protein